MDLFRAHSTIFLKAEAVDRHADLDRAVREQWAPLSVTKICGEGQ